MPNSAVFSVCVLKSNKPYIKKSSFTAWSFKLERVHFLKTDKTKHDTHKTWQTQNKTQKMTNTKTR